MAIRLETTIRTWNGLSSDEKPSSGVSEGSTLYLVDTGEHYVYHNGMWETDLRHEQEGI